MSNARQPIGSGGNTRQPMGASRTPTQPTSTRQPSSSPTTGARQPIGSVQPTTSPLNTRSTTPVEPMIRSTNVDSGRYPSQPTSSNPLPEPPTSNTRSPLSGSSGASRVANSRTANTTSPSTGTDRAQPPTPSFQPSRTPTGPRVQSGIVPNGAVSSGMDSSAPRTTQPPRASHNRARRISKIFIEKEKKSDYWQAVIDEVNTQGVFNQDDINNFIARAVSLEVVSNFKDREAQGGTAPQAAELVAKVSDEMYKHIVELNNGRGVNVPGTGLEKIKNMERFLLALEAKKEKEAEIEAQKVQAKIGELSQTIQAKEREKNTEREQYRRSIMVEMNDLKEQMKNVGSGANSAADARAMTQKMLLMEQNLRKMNEDKGKEDQETLALKKKLAVFEAKMKQLEEEKQLRAQADNADGLRDKLILMEEKLAKMERRKSVSITLMMQQQMTKLEDELKTLRAGGGGGGGDAKVQALEKKLLEMQNAKIDVNDPETRHLRSHIKKLEEQMLASERTLEEQAQKMEMERRLAQKKREEEEELTRKRNQKRDELFIEQMQRLEDKIKNGSGDSAKLRELEQKLMAGGGGGGGTDAAVLKQMKELQDRLAETENKLLQERSQSEQFWDVLNGKQGAELEGAQKDLTIMFLKNQTAELMKRLDEQANLMKQKFQDIDTKIEKVATMGPVGGGTVVRNTGMSYGEIQAKMEEIQKKLFDENIEERESEALNIEYEKLVTELESTKEYQAEQAAIVQAWKDENVPLNKAALERLRAELASYPPMKKTAALKRKPELKFIDCDHDQIMKKHVNDFKGLTTQNLTLDEARALYGCMPEFRKDQESQLQFVGQLKEKIENEMKKPKVKPPPPIVAKKPVVFKPPPQRGGNAPQGDFLAELMKKRKQQG